MDGAVHKVDTAVHKVNGAVGIVIFAVSNVIRTVCSVFSAVASVEWTVGFVIRAVRIVKDNGIKLETLFGKSTTCLQTAYRKNRPAHKSNRAPQDIHSKS